MPFTNPIFLWALTGLSIPIGIHLLSRKEGKIIRLGSLRHVHETSTQQFRGIRLNEILLLILRCLLIILFSLILAGLHWNNVGKKSWLLIEKGLETQPSLKTIFDSLSSEGYESRLLAKNFPLLKDSGSISASADYGTLIEELKTRNLSDVIVFAQNRVDNFKGLRSVPPPNVRWISQPLPPLDYSLQAVAVNGDSVALRSGHTNSEATHFTTEKVSKSNTIDIQSLDTIRITILSDEEYAYDKRIIKAALEAISKSIPIELKVEEKTSIESSTVSDWLIWLSDSDMPVTNSTKILQIKSTPFYDDLILPFKSSHWIITKRLNEEVALKENLTLRLASLIIPSGELEMKANSKDRRIVSDSIAWATNDTISNNAAASVLSESGNPYLILLLLGVLFAERIIAYKRNQ